MTVRWRIELLDGLRALETVSPYAGDPPRTITRFRTRKTGLLLAYLALQAARRPGLGTPREQLVELLWPEAGLDAGRASLCVALSSLRHQLEPPGAPGSTVLLADRQQVLLAARAIECDVGELEEAARRAERVPAGPERFRLLERAAELGSRTLLPGHYEEWVLEERGPLAALALHCWRRLAAGLAEAGEFPRAAAAAARAASLEPLDEGVRRELIRVLLRAGDAAAARAQYRDLERRLRAELNSAPEAATRALLAQIAAAEQAGTLAVPAGAAPELAAGVAAAVRRAPPETAPAGTVTLLLAADAPAGKATAAARLVAAAPRYGGRPVPGAGDTAACWFSGAAEALACLAEVAAGDPTLRLALDTADLPREKGGHAARALAAAAAILAAAHPGEPLCSERTAVLLRRDALWTLDLQAELVDLGAFRLEGRGEPEHLFGVRLGHGGAETFQPPAAPTAHQARLPLRLTRFIGRQGELELLCTRLDPEATPEAPRLVTLTGPGGVGKTRLALEAADCLAGRYRGAVWLVELAEPGSAGALGAALLAALRQEPLRHRPPLEQAAVFLAAQPSLLLLDNAEQPLSRDPAAMAAQICRLLEAAPRLRCVVTSRRRLGVPGEQELPVVPLPVPALPTVDAAVVPEVPAGPAALAELPGVRLFLDRARLARPDFQLTEANAAAVAALCARLEGIPLALELAAARAHVLTPAQMVARLARPLEFLVSYGGHQRALPERQRTLRSAIEWSYALLTPEEQSLFRRLAVFRGGWSLEAAEAVCGEEQGADTLELLARLVECSLVVVEEAGEAGRRFRMLESLREYALERLEEQDPAERDALRGRHASCYQELATGAELEFAGRKLPERLAHLEREHDNLRAALGWCVDSGDAATALALATALTRFWDTRGYVAEGWEWLQRALAIPGEVPEVPRARALNAAGNLARVQGNAAAARAAYREALSLLERRADSRALAAVLNNLGLTERSLGDEGARARARGYFERALELNRAAGNATWEAYNLNNLGLLAWEEGNYAEARRLAEASLALKRLTGDLRGLTSSLNNLGNALLALGEVEAAEASYEEGLATGREVGSRRSQGSSLVGLARAALARGRPAAARAHLRAAAEAWAEHGDPRGMADVLEVLACLVLQEGGGRWDGCGAAGERARAEGRAAARRACRLLGAAAELRERSGAAGPLPERERLAGQLELLLGPDRYRMAWQAGRALTREQALALGLDGIEGSPDNQ